MYIHAYIYTYIYIHICCNKQTHVFLSLSLSVSLTLSLLNILRRRRLKCQPPRRCVWLYARCLCVSFLVHVSVCVCPFLYT